MRASRAVGTGTAKSVPDRPAGRINLQEREMSEENGQFGLRLFVDYEIW
jgi:hypothetical protein